MRVSMQISTRPSSPPPPQVRPPRASLTALLSMKDFGATKGLDQSGAAVSDAMTMGDFTNPAFFTCARPPRGPRRIGHGVFGAALRLARSDMFAVGIDH